MSNTVVTTEWFSTCASRLSGVSSVIIKGAASTVKTKNKIDFYYYHYSCGRHIFDFRIKRSRESKKVENH